MPIYEFYCQKCHAIYSFLSRSTNVAGEPKCPKCGRLKLEKQVSRFAISKGLKESSESPDPFAGVDEEKMEQAMMQMAGEFDNVNEEDPKQMARMMRKMFDATGMQPTGSIEEAMRRMESGEDPDKVDEEMGDSLDSEDPFSLMGAGRKGTLKRLFEPPNVDPGLYDL